MTIIIAGAGIGGLVTALSLHRAGISCRIFEAVPEIKALGVGINLLPHAVRELTELGLAGKLAETAIPTAELIYANRHGQRIWQEARGRDAGYNWPQFSIARGALQIILRDAVLERMGPDAICPGHELTRFDQTADGVTVHFRDRDTGAEHPPVSGTLLIGCDGIHSAVRRQLYPNEGSPIWNGCVLWRATTLGDSYLTGRSMIMAGHANQKFVCYPISRAEHDQGRALINWIAEIRYPTDPPWRQEDWNRPGRIEDFMPAFEGWDFGWLKVPEIIRGAHAIYEYPMVDRDPLTRWSFGRATLLGDAAHAMYPIGSNGASQAILDGRVLALNLARAGKDPVAGLAAYDAERRPPTSAIVLANRGNGPEQALQLVEDRAPDGFEAVHDVVAPDELDEIAARYKTTAGFDVDTLNSRPSFDP